VDEDDADRVTRGDGGCSSGVFCSFALRFFFRLVGGVFLGFVDVVAFVVVGGDLAEDFGLDLDLVEVGVDLVEVGLGLVDVGVDLEDFGVDLVDVGVDLEDTGDLVDVGVDFADVGVDLADLGVDFADVGVDLADLGVDLVDERVDLGGVVDLGGGVDLVDLVISVGDLLDDCVVAFFLRRRMGGFGVEVVLSTSLGLHTYKYLPDPMEGKKRKLRLSLCM